MNNIVIKRLMAYFIDFIIVALIASCFSYLSFINPNRVQYEEKYQEILTLYDKLEQKEITKEEYEAKRCNIPDGQDEEPLPMNPPEEPEKKPRERKTRDIQPEGDSGAAEQEALKNMVQEAEQGGSGRSRRTRRTRG